MRRLGLFLAALLFAAMQVNAQDQKNDQKPDEQITVNKKYDDNGNLIQFDSTYVHSWSSDSTMHSAFPDNPFFSGKDFPDIDQFLKEFMNDSTFKSHQGISPFDNDEFFKQFGESFPDSLMQNFSLKHDSVYFDFPMDSLKNLPPGFMPDMDELMQGLQKHLGNIHQPFSGLPPKFQSPEEQKEWQQLMEKHHKEMEEFRKKWEHNNNSNL